MFGETSIIGSLLTTGQSKCIKVITLVEYSIDTKYLKIYNKYKFWEFGKLKNYGRQLKLKVLIPGSREK